MTNDAVFGVEPTVHVLRVAFDGPGGLLQSFQRHQFAKFAGEMICRPSGLFRRSEQLGDDQVHIGESRFGGDIARAFECHRMNAIGFKLHRAVAAADPNGKAARSGQQPKT